MKLSKGVRTEIVAQLVVVVTIIVQQKAAPDDVALLVAVISAIESIALALWVHFAAEDKIAAFAKANGLKR